VTAILRSRWAVLGGFVVAAVLLFAVAPLVLTPFRLDLLGKYLCYAMVAVGLPTSRIAKAAASACDRIAK